MASYRILKSVAHNWAHSLLSDGSFAADTTVTQLLLEAARESSQPSITIDPLTETIFPESAATPTLRKGLANLRQTFLWALESQGCTVEMVAHIELHIDFDLQRPAPKYSDISPGVWYSDRIRMPEAATYVAYVHLVDARGHEYKKQIPEFWRN